MVKFKKERIQNDEDTLTVVDELFVALAGAGAARGHLQQSEFQNKLTSVRHDAPPIAAKIFYENAWESMDPEGRGVAKRASFMDFMQNAYSTELSPKGGCGVKEFCKQLSLLTALINRLKNRPQRLDDSEQGSQHAIRIFKMLDVDGNGAVSRREFQAFRRAMSNWCEGAEHEGSVLQGVTFDMLDEDDIGYITFEGFKVFMDHLFEKSGEEGFLNLLGNQLVGWEKMVVRKQHVRGALSYFQDCLDELQAPPPGAHRSGPRASTTTVSASAVAPALFDVLDADGSGSINKEEFGRFMRIMSEGGCDDVVPASDFNSVDTNGDGQCSTEELMGFVEGAFTTLGRRAFATQLQRVLYNLKIQIEEGDEMSEVLDHVLREEASLEEPHDRLCELCEDHASREPETDGELFGGLFLIAALANGRGGGSGSSLATSGLESTGLTRRSTSGMRDLRRRMTGVVADAGKPASSLNKFGCLWTLECFPTTTLPLWQKIPPQYAHEFVLLPGNSRHPAALRAIRTGDSWAPVSVTQLSRAPLQVLSPSRFLRCRMGLQLRTVRAEMLLTSMPMGLQDFLRFLPHDIRAAGHEKKHRSSKRSSTIRKNLTQLTDSRDEFHVVVRGGSVISFNCTWVGATAPSADDVSRLEDTNTKLPELSVGLRMPVPDGEYAFAAAHWPTDVDDPGSMIVFTLRDLHMWCPLRESKGLVMQHGDEEQPALEVNAAHPWLELSHRPHLDRSWSEQEEFLEQEGKHGKAPDPLDAVSVADAIVVTQAGNSLAECSGNEEWPASTLLRSLEQTLDGRSPTCNVRLQLLPGWLAYLRGLGRHTGSDRKDLNLAQEQFAEEYESEGAASRRPDNAEQAYARGLVHREARERVHLLWAALRRCPDAGPLALKAVNSAARAGTWARCLQILLAMEEKKCPAWTQSLIHCVDFRRFDLGLQIAEELLGRNAKLAEAMGSNAAEHMLGRGDLSREEKQRSLSMLFRHGAPLGPVLKPMVKQHRCDEVVLLLEACLGERAIGLRKKGFADLPSRSMLTGDKGAAARGRADEVKALIYSGTVSMNVRDCNGWTAAHHASWHGHKSVLEVLFKLKANLDMIDNKGCTPLHICRVQSVAMQLRNWGCSISAVDHTGCTPLMRARSRAAQYGEHQSAVKALEPSVQWTEIDSVLSAAPLSLPALDVSVTQLVNIGFSGPDRSAAEPRVFVHFDDGKRGVNPADELQLRNQLIGKEACDRGLLLVERLLCPLLELAGQRKLKDVEGGAQRLSLCRYMLKQRVPSFAPIQVLAQARAGSALLTHLLLEEYEKEENVCLRTVIDAPSLQVNAGEKWKMMHQQEAHGSLEWLETGDEIESVAVLAEYDVFETAEDLCDWGAGELWGRMAFYGLFLQAVAASVDDRFYNIISDLAKTVPGTSCARGPLKAEARIMVKGREDYAEASAACYGSPEFGVGGVVDIARLAICCEDAKACACGYSFTEEEKECRKCGVLRPTAAKVLTAMFELLTEQRIKADGVEVVRVKNGFHQAAESSGGYRDVKLSVLVESDMGMRHIAEVQLLLQRYLQLKKFQHALYEVERGDCYDARGTLGVEIFKSLEEAGNQGAGQLALRALRKATECAYKDLMCVKEAEASSSSIVPKDGGAVGPKKRVLRQRSQAVVDMPRARDESLLAIFEAQKRNETMAPLNIEEQSQRVVLEEMIKAAGAKGIPTPASFDSWYTAVRSDLVLAQVSAKLQDPEFLRAGGETLTVTLAAAAIGESMKGARGGTLILPESAAPTSSKEPPASPKPQKKKGRPKSPVLPSPGPRRQSLPRRR